MNAKCAVEMDSYRLAQYSVQIPCYVCGSGNTFDAELCRHCMAPMALAHQANSQKIEPRMIATVGSAAAGKTVYLGMLTDMLSRENTEMQLFARGAFSVSLQQQTINALANCCFPDKTPNEPDRWNWVHCQIKARCCKQPFELIIPDLAGEAILEEINHPHSFPVIRAYLSKCAGIMVLIDAQQLEQEGKDQDYFAMKVISYLCELEDHPKQGWPNRPVALVFTKADQCEPCFENPADYAQEHAPGVWQLCQERIRRHHFFATGVAGAVAYQLELEGRRRVPLRVEPRGVVDPFAWLVRNLNTK